MPCARLRCCVGGAARGAIISSSTRWHSRAQLTRICRAPFHNSSRAAGDGTAWQCGNGSRNRCSLVGETALPFALALWQRYTLRRRELIRYLLYCEVTLRVMNCCSYHLPVQLFRRRQRRRQTKIDVPIRSNVFAYWLGRIVAPVVVCYNNGGASSSLSVSS